MSKRIPYIGAFLMLAVICSVLLTGCSKSLQSQSASRTELVMSTVVTITLYGEQAQEGVNAAFQKAKDLEKILSSQNEKSELHQRNSKKDGKLYSVITVLLAIMAVIYGGMGLLGLLTYFGIV